MSRWSPSASCQVGNYQQVSISEKGGVRTLHLGNATVQSAMRLTAPDRLELSYTRSMMAVLLFMPRPHRVLAIGIGGGSLIKYILKHCSEAQLTAVEINPQVVQVARDYFYLPDTGKRFQVKIADGVVFVSAHPAAADVILLDGFTADRQAEELATDNFYRDCRAALSPGGVLTVNYWAGDRKFGAYLTRLENAFEGCLLRLPARRPGNVIAFAFHRSFRWPGWAEIEKRAQILAVTHELDFIGFAEDLQRVNRDNSRKFPNTMARLI